MLPPLHERAASVRAAVGTHDPPFAFVDLAAFDRNVARVVASLPAGSCTLRVATKSLRVPALIERALRVGAPRTQGCMTFSADETARLASLGFDDLLLAYPVATRSDAALLAQVAASGTRLRAVVDHLDQLPVLSAAALHAGTTLSLCLDVDMSTRLPGLGHIGVRRSPLQTPQAVVALARAIRDEAGLHLDAVLGYEAQVAGLPDHNPRNQPWLDPVRRRIKQHAVAAVHARRTAAVDALRADGFDVQVVNGGGSGSLLSTGRDPVVTEITAGSAFFAPSLFDHYDDLPLTPALFFVLPVTRWPAPGFVTCSGGGFIASGPPGDDRTPIVAAPPGLTPLPHEGWGEVQTPFTVAPGVAAPSIGDWVWCRPAKAGELAERFAHYWLVGPDGSAERVPTYRGLGATTS
jgi:D-serine deaminase-like pyridoxal phosphate-dependent protein